MTLHVSSVASPDTWLNTFLLVDALAVAAFFVIDFWMGPKGRKRLLRRCRRVFLNLRTRRYVEVYAVHALTLSLTRGIQTTRGLDRFGPAR